MLGFSSSRPVQRADGQSPDARHDDHGRRYQENHVPVVSDRLAHRQCQASFRRRSRGPVPSAVQRVYSVSEQDGRSGRRVRLPVTHARRVPVDHRESAFLRVSHGRRRRRRRRARQRPPSPAARQTGVTGLPTPVARQAGIAGCREACGRHGHRCRPREQASPPPRQNSGEETNRQRLERDGLRSG